MQKFLLKCIFIFFIFSLTTGCQPLIPGPVCQYNGIKYGKIKSRDFRGRWFHYYERGLSYMEGKCYDAALYDLKKSSYVRDKDSLWAKTYGMHFISYYPHREMGIIYYLMSEETADPVPLLYTARNELELSLSQVDTKKATKWLVKVNKRILELENQKVSIPDLKILTIAGKEFKEGDIYKGSKSQIEICGIAKDNQFISKILVGKKQILIEKTKQKVMFRQNINLVEGKNEIFISAYNLLGGYETKKIEMIIDQTGPDITITHNKDGLIKGFVNDNSNIKKITFNIDGIDKSIIPDENGNFKFLYNKPASQLMIFSVDEFNNSSRIIITNNLWIQKQFPLIAANNTLLKDDLISSNHSIKKPFIVFHGWPDKEIVFKDIIYIEGQVQGFKKLIELYMQINDGEKYNKLSSKLISANYKSFSHNTKLYSGINDIYVHAKDIDGKIYDKHLTIFKKIRRINKLENRYSIKLLEPDFIDETIGNLFPDNLSEKLTQNMKMKFHNLLLYNLKSQKRFFILNKDNSQNLTVNGIVIGSTTETLLGIEIAMRLVDIEKSIVIADINDYSFQKNDESLNELAKNISNYLNKRFPIFYGYIAKKIEHNCIVNINMEFRNLDPPPNIITNWPIIYFIEEPHRFNPINKKISLGSDTKIIGSGTVLGKMSDPFMFLGKGVNNTLIGYKLINK